MYKRYFFFLVGSTRCSKLAFTALIHYLAPNGSHKRLRTVLHHHHAPSSTYPLSIFNTIFVPWITIIHKPQVSFLSFFSHNFFSFLVLRLVYVSFSPVHACSQQKQVLRRDFFLFLTYTHTDRPSFAPYCYHVSYSKRYLSLLYIAPLVHPNDLTPHFSLLCFVKHFSIFHFSLSLSSFLTFLFRLVRIYTLPLSGSFIVQLSSFCPHAAHQTTPALY